MIDFIARTCAALERTPETLRALLVDRAPEEVTQGYGPDTFSAMDVLGHLIVGEHTDWIPRLRIILEDGEQRAFDPFDQQVGYSPDQGATINDLLDSFESLRGANITALQAIGLSETDLDRTGTHPALGVVSIGQLLSTWTVHDLHHVAQVCKAVAWQARNEVGAWRDYLGILRPPAR